jgi:hypothetical protein
MRRLIIASILLLTASHPGRSHGQFEAEPESKVRARRHDGYLVQVGAGEVSPMPLSIVTQSLKPMLPGWPKSYKTRVAASLEAAKLGSAQIVAMTVYVQPSDDPPADHEMRQVWEIARGQLEAELNRVTAMVGDAQQMRLHDEIARYESQREQLETEAAKLTEVLTQQQSESAGSETNFSKGIGDAFGMQRELQLRDAGLRARREAIELRIDKVRAQADASTQEDPIVSELAKVLEIREKTRRRLGQVNEKTPHAVTDGQLLEADAQLAQSRIEFLKAKRDVEDRAGGGVLRALNDELSKLLVESSEVEGQRKELESIIADLRKQVYDTARAAAEASKLQDQLQTLRGRQAAVDSQIGERQHTLSQATRDLIELRPLTVDESEPAEPEASAPGSSE